MITEIVVLYVKENQIQQFEDDFRKAGKYISAITGYRKHSLQKCLEIKNKYVLLVEWDSVEDHTIRFRESDEYQLWKKLLHHHYEPFPVVEHFYNINIEAV